MLGHLALIEPELQRQVEDALGLEGQADNITPAIPPRDLPPSDALSLVKKAQPTLRGRKIGVLLTDGFDAPLLEGLRRALKAEKCGWAIIAPKVGGAKDKTGKLVPADHSLSGAPSVFFDAVVILAIEEGGAELATQPPAVDWVRDAFGHFKILAYTPGAQALVGRAGIEPDEGVIELENTRSIAQFIRQARNGRFWEREAKLRALG